MTRQHVETFISRIACDEKDKSKKGKLKALQVMEDEWERVDTLIKLLEVRSRIPEPTQASLISFY
jgi:hypothetical protein